MEYITKFSAGYNCLNPNFVIQNVKESKKDCCPIFSVLHNIFHRGCPTIPSRFLQTNFGKPSVHSSFKYKLNFDFCKWNQIIKGGNNENPALKFYEEVLPKFVEFPKSFIPECPLNEIIEEFVENKNVSSQVDFYSPLYNTVIEIDGSQHIANSEQAIKDENRDSILKNHEIKIVRIPTNKISDAKFLEEKLKDLSKNNEYLQVLQSSFNPTQNDITFSLAIRLQLLFTMLYENKIIDLKEKQLKINIFSPELVGRNAFEIILKDFFSWLKNLAYLQNIDFVIPVISIQMIDNEEKLSQQTGINIYISAFELYSQANYKNIYYIRNDFFLYSQEQKSVLYKNRFKIHIANINYNLEILKHKNALEFILKNTSVYNGFRANQCEIIIECLNNTSVIGVLPTGAGKSLCYQFCAMLIPSATLVIAPLQLLMVDQHNNIKDNFGITNSTLINSVHYRNLEQFKKSKSLITIISPERFFSEKFNKCLLEKKIVVGFVVIDEAHCLSEWGHDFRTSYLCLSHNLKKYLPSTTYLMALTGTASHRVFEDIDCEFQNFKKRKTKAVFADSMRRDNLTIYIERPADKYKELVENITPTLIGMNKDKTLVFTKKKKGSGPHDSACISLMNEIKNDYGDIIKNENSISFYAGGEEIANAMKEQTLEDFKSGKLTIVFATKAFGMGVDIPDLRKTIHYGLPSSFESLYQQFGRAGRDGKPAKCFVYYNKENEKILNKFFSYPLMSISEMKHNLNLLNELQTNFYFIQSANLDENIEIAVVERLLKGIKKRNLFNASYVECKTIVEAITKQIKDYDLSTKFENLSNARMHIEKALYRLFLLGEIEMWNLVYKEDMLNPTFDNLKTTKLTEKEKLERLQSHIQKYQTNFVFQEENTFENRLKFLIKWANENYLQERIQTMKTLYEQCEQFIDSNSFMTYISNYFSNDPIYMRLVDRSVTLKEWVDALNTHPEKTRARISRLLESYDKIAALNYVSGITRLRLNDFENSDGRRRLMLALEEVTKLNEQDRMYLFDNTYPLLSNPQVEIFIDCWLQNFNQDAKMILQKTQSENCQDYLILDFANEILKIGELLNDKL